MHIRPLVPAGYKQDGDPLVTTLLQSTTSGQKLHRAPLTFVKNIITTDRNDGKN